MRGRNSFPQARTASSSFPLLTEGAGIIPARAGTTGSPFQVQGGKFHIRPLDGFHVEALVFDVQTRFLTWRVPLTWKSFLVGHRHRGAIVLDAAHLDAFQPLRLVIGQAIALPHPAIVRTETQATFKMNHPAVHLGNGLARTLFKNAVILLDLFLQEEFFTGTAFHAGKVEHGPHLI
jgi:hypothetical protein